MRVSRARISGSMLSRLGARWVTMAKDMTGSGDMALNRYSSASTPPAEAPTPTMGNGLSIGSPSRDRKETGLPAVGGSRQGYASALQIQRAFAALAMRLADGSVRDKSLCARLAMRLADGSVPDKSLCARSIVVRAESHTSGSCEISWRVLSINARVLNRSSRCSKSIAPAPEVRAASRCSLHMVGGHNTGQRNRGTATPEDSPNKLQRSNG